MSSPTPKRTVLITGCSDGGLGAALAIAFHKAGLHVYATARNVSKMSVLASHGIDTLPLDILSASSIASCVEKLSSSSSFSGLDILVNNAGGGYSMPISDIDIEDAKTLFDLNVWAQIAVTQAMLPLLRRKEKSKNGGGDMIVNHTSSASVVAIPFQGAYNASKAAMAMLSHTMRLELSPFGIAVVDVKSGIIESNFFENKGVGVLPADSIYMPAREFVEKATWGAPVGRGISRAKVWAEQVVADLLRSRGPPITVWRGTKASTAKWGSMLPAWVLDTIAKKMFGMDVVERMIRG
ncbi:hypothetical protein AJ80_07745 [Polytolypa hystricis UAMH7299]|uniref:Uncharacterized protein n=1 Tax=Polytolypa hystricis (strain UAMH7299) TaxID=1447883 RepID=A0A2B7XJD3_POLH7|nr:hypothetical protein AJ80_07745 [Polytolypa hystricis UAMH7299]